MVKQQQASYVELFHNGILEERIKIIDFVAKVSSNTYLNLMNQYYPCGDIHNIQELKTRVGKVTCDDLRKYAKKIGVKRLD